MMPGTCRRRVIELFRLKILLLYEKCLNSLIQNQNQCNLKIETMSITITFNELRRLKDSLPDGSMHRIADQLNCTVQTVRNYFGGENYQFGNSQGVHIEQGPDGGLVVLDDSTIYDMAMDILNENKKEEE